MPGWLISLACAVALVVIVFPEIFFAGGSFSSIPLDKAVGQTYPKTVDVDPQPRARASPPRAWSTSAPDAWQFEPTIRYMANILRNGSNPDWNPYLASGELGPETLDGMQLSPLVLVIAALGGSSTAYTVGLMALMVLALYCLLQFFTRTLDMHRLAGIGAGVVYLLSGWATSTLGDVTGVPYLMFPIVLYALTEFQRRRRTGPVPAGRRRLRLPVRLDVQPGPGPRRAVDHRGGGGASICGAVTRRTVRSPWPGGRSPSSAARPSCRAWPCLSIAVILVPALDAYRHGGPDVTSYGHQVLATLSPQRWLLVPTQVTQSLQSSQPTARTVEYLGIAPLVLTAAAWPRVRGLYAVAAGGAERPGGLRPWSSSSACPG